MGGAGAGIVVAQEDAGVVLQQVLDLEHLQGGLVDGPHRHERAGVAVGAGHAERGGHAAGDAATGISWFITSVNVPSPLSNAPRPSMMPTARYGVTPSGLKFTLSPTVNTETVTTPAWRGGDKVIANCSDR